MRATATSTAACVLRGACRALPHPAVLLPPLSALRGHSRCAAAFDWAACARAGSTASALYFGADGAAARFVSLRHDDEAFKYFFGELLLCFRFEHEGDTHECVFVEYVWPETRTAAEDGVPLETRYSHTRRRTIAVAPVAAVQFVAPLFSIVPMEPPAGPRPAPCTC